MSLPRLAPKLVPCRCCGAASFLRIAPVREHGQGGVPTPMAVAYLERRRDLGPFARAVSCVGPKVEQRAFGSYVVVVCAKCGHTRWIARELSSEVAAELAPAVDACECGDHRALRIDVARTRGAGGQPSPLRVLHFATRRWGFTSASSMGHFSTLVCRSCGRTTWVASDVDKLPLTPQAGAPCTRCSHTLRFVVEPVNEDGATLRVLYDRVHMKDIRIGSYALSICAGCGVTAWSARGIESLTPDASLGVAVLEVDDAQEGPYR